MEWLRSCYESKWRLFVGHPEILTPGGYVRLPLDADHLPLVHFLGSFSWVRGQVSEQRPLGEVTGLRPTWRSGLNLVSSPEPIILGDPAELTDGARWPLPLVRDFIGGWDKRCFARRPSRTWPTTLDELDIADCRTLDKLAEIQNDFYSNAPLAHAKLRTLLGPNVQSQNTPNSASVLPGSLVAENEGIIVVVVSGTSNFIQLACQALYTALGPVNQGFYGTLSLWQSAAIEIQKRVFFTVSDQNKPILVVGHSYGGATAAVMCARYLIKTPARDIRLLTFGCPRPGDGRLIGILHGMKQLNIRNQGDPVPGCPPHSAELGPLSLTVPPLLQIQWNRFESVENTRLYSGVEDFVEGGDDPSIFFFVLDCVARALAHLPVPNFVQHEMETYRTNVACAPTMAVVEGSLIVCGEIAAGGLVEGSIVVAGEIAAGGLVEGSIVVAGQMSAVALVHGSVVVAGQMSAVALVHGSVVVAGEIAGAASIEGSVVVAGDFAGITSRVEGSIVVGGGVAFLAMEGSIIVAGDVAGYGNVEGSIVVAGDFAEIVVQGSLVVGGVVRHFGSVEGSVIVSAAVAELAVEGDVVVAGDVAPVLVEGSVAIGADFFVIFNGVKGGP